jgi:alpha-amylase
MPTSSRRAPRACEGRRLAGARPTSTVARWGAGIATLLALSTVANGCTRRAPAADSSVRQTGSQEAFSRSAETFWNNATIYFLLTDRFQNGDPSNDLALGRQQDGAPLRSFLGGDLAGVREKLEEGWFDALGVNAIWMTPFVEQIQGTVDEGTGKTYGFHGYWARDWTAVDPAFGTEEELRALISAAHARGIRVLMDAVINHTGPVTPLDPQWPAEWVRTSPRCIYESYETTVECTLVDNLPDVLTARNDAVDLPPPLREKWAREGRLERELAELDAFFERTGFPRAPRYYLIKWLTDWVREYGIDGYRVDTAKHFQESVSAELRAEAGRALADWRRENSGEVLDDQPFYMMGEVYNYEISHGRAFDFGDRTIDFYDFGYAGLINFAFKRDAHGSLEGLFSRYARTLREGSLQGLSVVNYVSSHDDSDPYDRDRTDPFGAGTRLLLAPGAAQIYYGDELARPLRAPGAEGDANLRTMMNWNDLEQDRHLGGFTTRDVLEHWRKVGQFRRAHPAVGAGAHRRLQADPYVFSRALEWEGGADRVVAGLGLPSGEKSIPVGDVFPDGTEVHDAYAGARATVRSGVVSLDTPFDLVLLEAGDSP